jgi:preprotein translocase subunit SecG
MWALILYTLGKPTMLQSLMPILLSVHLLVCLFLIGAILVQRSEGGGALGMGGGPTSMMSGRSATTFITRTTTILAGIFFALSLALSIIGSQGSRAPGSVMDKGDAAPKAIDLSVPKAPVNAIVPPTGEIPASSPVAPAPLFPATSEAPASAPAGEKAPEKK